MRDKILAFDEWHEVQGSNSLYRQGEILRWPFTTQTNDDDTSDNFTVFECSCSPEI